MCAQLPTFSSTTSRGAVLAFSLLTQSSLISCTNRNEAREYQDPIEKCPDPCGTHIFSSKSASRALLYRFHRATKSSLYLVPHSQAIGKYKTGKELHREMELDFSTPYFIFLIDQVRESELEIIPSGFVLYDQT